MHNLELNERVVALTGDINKESVEKVSKELLKFVLEDEEKPITFFVSSDGGISTPAFALYEYITEVLKPKKLQTVVLGSADSMAIILLLTGYKRFMSSYATMFFHSIGRRFGERRLGVVELEYSLSDIKNLNERYAEIVSRRTKMKKSEILKLMKKEGKFTPKKALKLGFVHQILERK